MLLKSSLNDINNVASAVKQAGEGISESEKIITNTIYDLQDNIQKEITKFGDLSERESQLYISLNELIENIEADIMELESELAHTSPTIIDNFTDENGNDHTVERENPEYRRLKGEISSLRQKLAQCCNIKDMLSECGKSIRDNIETLQYSQKFFDELLTELSATVKSIERDIDNALIKLSNIKGVVNDYMSEKIIKAPQLSINNKYASGGKNPLLNNLDDKDKHKFKINEKAKQVLNEIQYAKKSNDIFGSDKDEFRDGTINYYQDVLEDDKKKLDKLTEYYIANDDEQSKEVIDYFVALEAERISQKVENSKEYQRLKNSEESLLRELNEYKGQDIEYINELKQKLENVSEQKYRYDEFLNHCSNFSEVVGNNKFYCITTNKKSFIESYDSMITTQHASDCGPVAYVNAIKQLYDQTNKYGPELKANEENAFKHFYESKNMTRGGYLWEKKDDIGGTTIDNIINQCKKDGFNARKISRPKYNEIHEIIRCGKACMLTIKSDNIAGNSKIKAGRTDHWVNVVGSVYNDKNEAIGFWINNSNRRLKQNSEVLNNISELGTNKYYISNKEFEKLVNKSFVQPITAIAISKKD